MSGKEFNLQAFVASPSLAVFSECKKADFVSLAKQYGVSVGSRDSRDTLRNAVWDKLVELGIFVRSDESDDLAEREQSLVGTPGSSSEGAGSGPGLPGMSKVKPEAPPAEDKVKDDPPSLGQSDDSEYGSDEETEQEEAESVSSKLRLQLARLRFKQKESRRRAAQAARELELAHIHTSTQLELEHKLALRKLELEAETQVRIRQLELQSGAANTESMSLLAGHDVRRHIDVPPFRETEVDTYFSTFERLATALHWPKEIWSTLLQCKFTGKAQDVVAALSLEDSLDYEKVKAAVLRAYELVPEAYRQKFREYRKSTTQTFVEFARNKGNLFDKWCNASKAKDYASLRELVLLEDFKKGVPERCLVYLNEQKVNTLSEAAIFADEFTLTHKLVFVPPRGGAGEANPHARSPEKSKRSPVRSRDVPVCGFCHKKGHIKPDCVALKRKKEGQKPPKPTGLVKIVPNPPDSSPDKVKTGYKPFPSEGFVSRVSQGTVRAGKDKVRVIANFPVPTTRRELRRFIGMAGYYHGFCRNFSSVIAPLTSLLSESQPFSWTPECQHAFESAKALLCSTPVLAAPDFKQPFKLEVDASGVGAGAVLFQESADGIDHPVCFFSKKFNKHQLNYSTIGKEALALLLALQHFEVYLGSSPVPVTVYTDHNPLVFLSRMYNQNQRLMRWALIAQNYNLEIKHKKGTENIMADALSRTH